MSGKASVSFPVSLSSAPVDGLLADPAETWLGCVRPGGGAGVVEIAAVVEVEMNGVTGHPVLSSAGGEGISAFPATDSASSTGVMGLGSGMWDWGTLEVGSNGETSLGWDSKSSLEGAASVSVSPLMAFSGWARDADRL